MLGEQRVKERVTHEFWLLTVTDLREEIITSAAKLAVSFHTKNHVCYVIKHDNQINLLNLHKSSVLLLFRSAAVVLSVMWHQVAHCLQLSCIIALRIIVRLQQGYSNTKIYCNIYSRQVKITQNAMLITVFYCNV